LIYFYFNFFKYNSKSIFKYSILSFILICLPLLLSKIIFFHDPFSPFLESFFNNDPDIIYMSEMYKNWDGFSKDNPFKIINFVIPLSPYSWIDTFGLIILFPIIFKLKNNSWYLILLLILVTTIVSYSTNFQSRWYIPILLTMLLFAENCNLKKRNIFTIFINFYNVILFSFFFIYLLLIVHTHVVKGIEHLKSERIYLYSFFNEQKLKSDEYIVTNARNIFFTKNLLGYRYKDYSKSIILKMPDKNIKYGIFFGVDNLNAFEKILGIPISCISNYSFDKIKVAKRNIFALDQYEKVLKVEFKESLTLCL